MSRPPSANGRSLGGRKQTQNSPKCDIKAASAQARRERIRRGPEIFYNYKIHFTRPGETLVREFRVTNPGSAFAQCLKEFPGRIFLESWHEARLITEGGDDYHLVCVPASMVSIVTKPESSPKEISCHKQNRRKPRQKQPAGKQCPNITPEGVGGSPAPSRPWMPH
jgi:hypothetical protein